MQNKTYTIIYTNKAREIVHTEVMEDSHSPRVIKRAYSIVDEIWPYKHPHALEVMRDNEIIWSAIIDCIEPTYEH